MIVVISFRVVSGNCVVDEDSISFSLISLSLHTNKCVMEGLCVRAWGALGGGRWKIDTGAKNEFAQKVVGSLKAGW